MFLFLFATLFSGLMVVDCSATVGRSLPMTILNGSNHITTTRDSIEKWYNSEKKAHLNAYDESSGELFSDNDKSNVDFPDAKLAVTPSKKINYNTSDYFSETADDYPELSHVEHFLEDIMKIDSQIILKKPPKEDSIEDSISYQTSTRTDINVIQYRPHSLRPNYITLCDSHTKTIKPRLIQNVKGDYVKVVNYDEYEQAMFVEVCDSEGSSCSYAKHFSNGLKPICAQHFIYRRTAIFAESPRDPSKPIEFEDIPIPASCVCDLMDETF